MAKKEKKEKRDEKEKAKPVLADVRFSRLNYLLFGIGLVSVVIGFILLRSGSIVLAPILLVLGYLVFFPLGLLLK